MGTAPPIAKVTRPIPSGYFPRRRLYGLLDKARKSPILWITGPPGCGKTALVSSYIESRRLPCLWYKVDESDADLATFFYYLGLAAGKAAPRKKKPLPLLTPERLPGLPVFAQRYFEELSTRLPVPCLLVLDDCYRIQDDSPFFETVRVGISRLAPGIGTVFRGTGLQVKEGTHDLVSLAGLFNGLVRRPTRTILVGYSLGSLIALKSAEEIPGYDGFIAGCTLASGTPKGEDFVGAAALAYDTLFGWPPEWGKWYDVRDDINFNTEVLPVLLGQLSDPSQVARFEFMRVLFDTPFVGYYQNPGWFFFHMFIATEALGELERRAGGPVVQNVDHVYALGDADKGYLMGIGFSAEQIEYLLYVMNSKTTVTAAARQRHYLVKYFDPSGDFQRPVISIHETGDGFISACAESVLRDTVKAANKEDMLVQAYTDGQWHCGFTGPQLPTTIQAMDYWLDTGTKPGPEFFPSALGFIPGYVPPAWPIGTK